MKNNNLFVSGKKVALMALLACALNTNAKAYDEGMYAKPNSIEAKQNKKDKIVWALGYITGLCGAIYFIKDFERNKQK